MSVNVRNVRQKIVGVVDPDRYIRDFVRNARGHLTYRGIPLLPAAAGNQRLYEAVLKGEPFAAAKIGATELRILTRFAGIVQEPGRYSKDVREEIFVFSGVYPVDTPSLDSFAERWIEDFKQINLLSVWFNPGERKFIEWTSTKAELTTITALEPYYFDRPWTESLAGKKVLVISPFVDSVERNQPNFARIWAKHPKVLPSFDLRLQRFPHSAAISTKSFRDWSDIVAEQCAAMDEADFDVAIVGAGAASVPLVAHAKRAGKVAVHLGGSTQILFGIIGARWDRHPTIRRLFNEHWTRPLASEVPVKANLVENACYW